MRITVEPGENSATLHLRGEFDIFYCPMLEKEISSLVAAGVKDVVLNLRLVGFINSTALGAIFKVSKFLKQHDGRLVISRPSSFCFEIIRKIGLDRVVPIYDSDEAARAALRGDHPAAESDDEASILFSPTDPRRVELYIPQEQWQVDANLALGSGRGGLWWGVGRLSALNEDGVRFTWDGGTSGLTPFEMGQMLALGTGLNVKFRLPLSPTQYCEAVVDVARTEERRDGVKVGADFQEIQPEMHEVIRRHSEALAFLKRELKRTAEPS